MRLVPMTITDAKKYIRAWHRHNPKLESALFAVGVAHDEICGVAVVGRPKARALQDGYTAEIVRVATDGTYNACSMLYGACLRACKSLGYRRVYTYTLQSEPGASLRASGFVEDARLKERPTWSCPSRPRTQTNLFGEEQRPAGPKIRWIWTTGRVQQVTEPAIDPIQE